MNHPLTNTALLVLLSLLVFGLSLLVRRRGHLDDVDTGPWASTLSYVAAAYGVVIGFSILLLFGQFADARQAVGDEATSIGTAFEQAALFPGAAPEIQQALVCYAESASEDDWPAMRAGGSSPATDEAFAALVQSLGSDDEPATGALHAATATNLAAQVGNISTARETRLVAAEARVPTMLWGLLVGGGLFVILLIFVVTLPAPPRTQALLVAMATAFTAVMLLVVFALSAPFSEGQGRVSPRLIDETVATMRSSANAEELGGCDR